MDQLELCKEIRDICLSVASKVDQLNLQTNPPNKPDIDLREDTILNYLDVCQILHISVRQLRRLCASKELTGFKNGRRRYFLSSEVSLYIQKLQDQKQ